jgi:hypothetical protein
MSKLGGNIMKCKNCGQEIDKKAVVCTGCGRKLKKPFYKRWWLWAIIIIVIAIVSAGGGNENTETANNNAVTETKEIVYEAVDLQTMFDDLTDNAMKAESLYQNKYVEFECKIDSFDSDGSYITVEPVNASEWNFTTAMCYINDKTQKEFLIQKSAGDSITIKGKVKSIGEVMGYSIDIKEVY